MDSWLAKTELLTCHHLVLMLLWVLHARTHGTLFLGVNAWARMLAIIMTEHVSSG
jgi:hypothetical protein